MTWLFHMIMELWLESQINHFSAIKWSLWQFIYAYMKHTCFLQNADWYLNYPMTKNTHTQKPTQKHHAEIPLRVAQNPQSKSCASRIKKATESVPFAVSCTMKCKAANLRHTAEWQCSSALLSVTFPFLTPELLHPQILHSYGSWAKHNKSRIASPPPPPHYAEKFCRKPNCPEQFLLRLPAQHSSPILTIPLSFSFAQLSLSCICVVLFRWTEGRLMSQVGPSEYPNVQHSDWSRCGLRNPAVSWVFPGFLYHSWRVPFWLKALALVSCDFCRILEMKGQQFNSISCSIPTTTQVKSIPLLFSLSTPRVNYCQET